jgi:hypothetical protein
MAQTEQQAQQVAQRYEAFHGAIHQASSVEQIREVCQAAAADYTARNQGQPAGQVVAE